MELVILSLLGLSCYAHLRVLWFQSKWNRTRHFKPKNLTFVKIDIHENTMKSSSIFEVQMPTDLNKQKNSILTCASPLVPHIIVSLEESSKSIQVFNCPRLPSTILTIAKSKTVLFLQTLTDMIIRLLFQKIYPHRTESRYIYAIRWIISRSCKMSSLFVLFDKHQWPAYRFLCSCVAVYVAAVSMLLSANP